MQRGQLAEQLAFAFGQVLRQTADQADVLVTEAAALGELARVRLAAGDLPGSGDALSRTLEIYRAMGSRNGIELDVDQALVIRCEDGRWKEVTAVPLDSSFDAFWS